MVVFVNLRSLNTRVHWKAPMIIPGTDPVLPRGIMFHIKDAQQTKHEMFRKLIESASLYGMR